MTFALTEDGPAAAATRARLRDARLAYRGEGGSITIGEDGPTFCAVRSSGTMLDLLDEDDVSELDRRRSLSVKRFATDEARRDWLAAQPWQRDPAVRDVAETPPRIEGRAAGSRFSLRMYAGLSNSEVVIDAQVSPDGVRASCAIQLRDRPPIRFEVARGHDEWARFTEELRLLGAHDWPDFGTQAMDGLIWSAQHDLGVRPVRTGGANAYPPDGSGPEATPQFVRFLLAVERLVGRTLWPGFDLRGALGAIPDPRDRHEHALLAAVRAWGDAFEVGGGDPAGLTEPKFEKELLPHIQQLTSASCQVDVNGLMPDWPRVGRLDLQLTPLDPPTWVELKWAKSASTLHNCLWDAGKLASAIRADAAKYGYLLAGAPAAVWRNGRGPTPLLDVSNHLGPSLVANYQPWWDGWCKENPKTYPWRIPTPVLTVPTGDVRLVGPSGSEWLVRLARVESPGSESFATPCRARDL